MNPPPAEPGMALADVDTPALLVDLDVFEHNLVTMQAFARDAGLALRPHAKTHKCPAIALRQIDAGAVGVCCQKVGEAQVLVRAGVADVLVSNEIVGASKLRRLASLARDARVSTCVDDLRQVAALEEAAAAQRVRIGVLVEIDVGAGRCGVEPGEPAVALARRIAASRWLDFRGLQAYHGGAQHIRGHARRMTTINRAAALAADTAAQLARAGIACPVITGAGTGSFEAESASGVYTELQCGSYIFMDADYALNLDADGGPVATFGHSLFVYTAVMSRTRRVQAVVDAGLKALAVDSGLPRVVGLPGVEYLKASDEHGVLALDEAAAASLDLGGKLRLIPGHCDPTVNLHDWLVAIRGERVEEVWPIAARGALF